MSVALWLLGSWLVAYLGQYKKFGFWGFFFCSLLFSPLIGFIILIASSDTVYDHSEMKP